MISHSIYDLIKYDTNVSYPFKIMELLEMDDLKNLSQTDKKIFKILKNWKPYLESIRIQFTEKDNYIPKLHKRSISFDRAEQKVRETINHERKITLKNEWILKRSCYALDPQKEIRLEEFRIILKASITSLFTAIKALTSSEAKIKAEPNSIASLADAAVGSTFELIPFAGYYLKKAIKMISPVERLTGYCQKSKFIQLSSNLVTFKDMDAINEEFSSIVTAYYQAEILNPDENLTVVRQWTKPITDFVEQAIKWFTNPRFTEKYIFGTDDKKEKPDTSYKNHWDKILEKAIGQFLLHSVALSHEDIQTHRIASALSQPITPVSHSPLIFESEKGLGHTFSRIALLAYETERKIEELAGYWGYSKGENYQFYIKGDIQAFLFFDSKKIVLSFRGTDTAKNVMNDLDVRMEAPWNQAPEIQIHFGFWKGLQEIWPSMKEKILASGCKEIYFTGHSLGGALSVLAAMDLSFEENSNYSKYSIHVYTYGQPKCGNEAFVQKFDQKISCYDRYVNYLDPVPMIPTRTITNTILHHGGRLHWLDFEGESHDEKSYKQALQGKDQYGKDQVRRGIVKYAQHVFDHQMANYEQKLRSLASQYNRTFSYADFVQFEFENSSNFSSFQLCNASLISQVENQKKNRQKEHLREEVPIHITERRIFLESQNASNTILSEQQDQLFDEEIAHLFNPNQKNTLLKTTIIQKKYIELSNSIKNLEESSVESKKELEKINFRIETHNSEIEKSRNKIIKQKRERDFTGKSLIPFYGNYLMIRRIWDPNKFGGDIGPFLDPEKMKTEGKIIGSITGIPGVNTLFNFLPFLNSLGEIKEGISNLSKLELGIINMSEKKLFLESKIKITENKINAEKYKLSKIKNKLKKYK